MPEIDITKGEVRLKAIFVAEIPGWQVQVFSAAPGQEGSMNYNGVLMFSEREWERFRSCLHSTPEIIMNVVEHDIRKEG